MFAVPFLAATQQKVPSQNVDKNCNRDGQHNTTSEHDKGCIFSNLSQHAKGAQEASLFNLKNEAVDMLPMQAVGENEVTGSPTKIIYRHDR